jgi:MFS family permease
MTKNIKLLKIILPLNYTWFWSGIWLIYYLRFTDYAGVGLIYGIMVPLGLLLEVPTGAISDLIGKKKTLILAFLFNCLASLFIGLSTDFNQLLISVLFSVIAGALYSGTAEAIMYDSLKSENNESRFDTLFASIEKVSLLVAALASILGGFLYTQDVLYPWLARSFFLFIGLILSFFLIEPPIDSEKFSIANFINQTKQGFIQIFYKALNKQSIILLLLVLGFIYILTEEIEQAYAVELGFNPEQLGILFAILPLFSALGYQFYPLIKKKFGKKQALSVSIVTSLGFALITPFLSIISGTLSLFHRHLTQSIIKTITSDTVNSQIESKYRVTALSTFTLFVNLPYAVSPIVVGNLLNYNSSASVISFITICFIIPMVIISLNKILPKRK